jgi:hypothetical protein
VCEPSFYVPEQKLDVGGYNADFASFQLGYRLRRTRTASATTSLVAAWFGDGVSAEGLSGGGAEGIRFYDGSGDIAVVIWPFAATATLQGLTVHGAMGGRRVSRPAFYGRVVTLLEDDGQVLIQASSPASLFARTEHAATVDDPRFATVEAPADVVLDLHCPQEPAQVQLDGTSVPFSWNNQLLRIDVPAGAHRLVLY